MKKILCVLCTLLLLMGMSVPAFAQETVLNAEIPKTHMVTVESADGRVALDGVVCKGTAEVERHKEQNYRIIPDDGKVIDRVLYNGEDVTEELVKGVFTAPRLVRDAELVVTYKDAPPAPDDKKYDISGTLEDGDGNPIPGVTVEIGGKTDVTDEDGRFEIEDVPSGTHPVVVIDEDGSIIASGEITIDKADGDELILTVDKDGNPVIKPAKDTKDIDLTLVVGKDGSITVKNVADVTPKAPGDGKSPQTGDFSHMNVWFSLMAASAGVLLILMFRKRKVKTEKEQE